LIAVAGAVLVVACSSEPRKPTHVQSPIATAAPSLPPSATTLASPGPATSSPSTSNITATAASSSASAAPSSGPAPRPKLKEIARVAGVSVLETSNTARHVHGGKPAKIHVLAINLNSVQGKANEVRVTKLGWLHAHCRSSSWTSRKDLSVRSLDVIPWDAYEPTAKGAASVVLPTKPDWYQLRVHFDGITAYQACDKFGVEIELQIDGKLITFEMPYDVMRFEPLRRRP